MSTFEEGFAATEKAAESVLQALGDISRLARQLQRDARAGNIAAIRRGTGPAGGEPERDPTTGWQRH